MPVRLYDTLSRDLRELRPSDGKTFRFYVCGPTVYGPAHIGNFITFLRFDVLYRVLQLAGLNPYYVRNITDVDDKTIRDSIKAGESLQAFTGRWLQAFHEDSSRLGLLSPDGEPRATDHIAEQIALVESLIDSDHAYVGGDGSVYYRVSSFADYGKLSHFDPESLRTQDENSAGVTNLADEYERDTVADFALWKTEKPEDGGNAWDSPWGRGRPGWHLECSAMSRKYLGDTFDLHGGGEDLCFPHHENEIAQTEAVTGKPMSLHWMHGVHLLVEGKKMSKSLGNFFTLSDLLEKGYDPTAIRLAMLGGHYRQQFNFTLKAIDDAGSALKKLRKSIQILCEKAGRPLPDQQESPGEDSSFWGVLAPVWEALAEDLNTPAALGQLHASLKSLSKATAEEADAVLEPLAAILFALGLKLTGKEEEEESSSEIPEEIKVLAEKRWQAKANRDFQSADQLRDEIQAQGYRLVDSKEGYEIAPM